MKRLINAFFSAILLLGAVSTIEAMLPGKRLVKSAKKKVSHWAEVIEQALSGEIPTTVAITQLNTISNDSSPFSELPKHERNQIIFSISQFGISNDLTTTGKAINNLAQVNKELNTLINDPVIYFNISRDLANRFSCSNEEVARALQTEQAKRELFIQQELFDLCMNKNKLNEIEMTSSLLQLINNGVDLNFIYKNGDFPLMLAIYVNPVLAPALIELGAKLNIIDKENNTPLKAAQLTGNNDLVKLIESKLD